MRNRQEAFLHILPTRGDVTLCTHEILPSAEKEGSDDSSNNTDKSQKWVEPGANRCIPFRFCLHEVLEWATVTYNDRNQTSGCLRWGRGRKLTAKGHEGLLG